MKLRHIARYPFDIGRAKRIVSGKCDVASRCNGRPICLDIHSSNLMVDCGRHFASIAHWASEIDSPVILRCGKVLLAAVGHKPFGAKMLGMANVQWTSKESELPDDGLILIDVPQTESSRRFGDQQTIQMLIGKDILDHCPSVPYPMHPSVAPYATQEQIEACRIVKQRRGILFAGSQRAKYGRPVLGRDFGVLNRIEILTALRKMFAERVVNLVGDYDAEPRIPIVLPEPSHQNIPVELWLPTLGAHQFFLACPGIAQPLCHNLIESMSVGTIPIIEAGDRLVPELQDGVNAIRFRGYQGLREAVHRIDALSDREIQAISSNVVHYYDTHLSGSRFLKRLCDHRISHGIQQISLPVHSENLYRLSELPSVESESRRAA